MNKIPLLLVFSCLIFFSARAQWTNLSPGSEANEVKGCNAFAVALNGTAYAGYNTDLYKYESGQWTLIPPAGFPNLNVLQLVSAPDSSVYAGCIDLNDGSKAIVLQYKNGVWSKVGQSVSNAVSNKIALTFSQNGTPYILYSDSTTTNSPFSAPCFVKKISAGNWVPVGSGRAGAGFALISLTIVVDADDNPYVSIGSNLVKKLDAGVWADATPPSYFGDGLAISPSRRNVYLCSQYNLFALNNSSPYWQSISGPSSYSDLKKLSVQSDSNLVVLDSGKAVQRYNIAADTWTRLGYVNNWQPASALCLGIADTPYIYWPASGNIFGVAKLRGTNWETLGNGGISGGLSNDAQIAVDPQQVPYILFADFRNDGATVMKFVNNTWQPVGIPGSLPQGGTIAISPSGTVYVSGKTGTPQRLTVRKFEGGSWVLVGQANFSGSNVLDNVLAFSSNGTPYTGYTSYNSITEKYDPSVMKFENGSWTYIGQPSFYTGGTNFFTFAVAPDGTPYVGFGDLGVTGTDATMMRYANGNWSFVGPQGFSNVDRNVTMVIGTDGTPYFAGRNLADNSKISVLQYRNNAWTYVGPPSFSTGRTDWPRLTISTDNILAVSYFDRTENGIVSKKFVNNAWVQLGGIASLNGTTLKSSPAIAPSNTDIYIAWNVSGAYVKRFSGFDSSLRVCSGGSMNLYAGTPGNTYQWQEDVGTGFVNIADNSNYAGTGTAALQLMSIPGSFYGYRYRCLQDGNPGPVYVLKQVNTWTGAVSNSWSNPLNWKCGTVPNEFTDVEINAGTIVVDAAGATCRSLLLNPSVNYSVMNGASLTVVH